MTVEPLTIHAILHPQKLIISADNIMHIHHIQMSTTPSDACNRTEILTLMTSRNDGKSMRVSVRPEGVDPSMLVAITGI